MSRPILALFAAVTLFPLATCVRSASAAYDTGRDLCAVAATAVAQQAPPPAAGQQAASGSGLSGPRPGKPEWKGDRVTTTQKPITQWFVTFFAIVGVLYVITRTARRAHGD